MNGHFQVQKAYNFFRPNFAHSHWHSIIWRPSIPPKMAIFLWLAPKERLLTLDRAPFLNKGVMCLICKGLPESHQHLFLNCSVTKQIWTTIRDWILFRRQTTSLKATLNRLVRGRSTSSALGKIRYIGTAAPVYIIWLARNTLLHDHASFHIQDVTFKIKSIVLRYANLQHLL